jgi:hypothetical protein
MTRRLSVRLAVSMALTLAALLAAFPAGGQMLGKIPHIGYLWIEPLTGCRRG